MTTLAEKIAEFAADIPDWQVADSLNQPDGMSYGYRWIDIPCAGVREALMATGEWLTAKTARVSEDASIRAAADLLIDLLTLQERIAFSQANYRTIVQLQAQVLINAGVLSQATVEAVLLGKGRQALSWAEKEIGSPVTARDVGLARGGK